MHSSTDIESGVAPRVVQAGPWRVALHAPRLVFRGDEQSHITRPNLCSLSGALVAIYQTTFDTSATPHDDRQISVSTDGGVTWRVAARNVDIGSFAMSCNGKEAVVMPYDSLRFGADLTQITGPRVAMRWRDGKLQLSRDETVARFPGELMTFLPEPIMGDDGKPLYLADDLPPADKPITSFWGNIQTLSDGRWIAPAYGCYADDPRAVDSPAPEMRRMARFTTELLVSDDRGRTWDWHGRIATPADVPDTCVEGPSEVQLFFFDDCWRAVFRTSALKGFFAPLYVAESKDGGRNWSTPRVLKNVSMIMDPRGLQLPGGITVLSAGRPKLDMYLADGDSEASHALDLTAHHESFFGHLRTTGHTDVVALGPRKLMLIYDSIPDSWRWPGSVFTAPDAIYCVQIDILEGKPV